MNKDNSVLVSVIMITYGHEHFIREAILGVLNQQCNFAYELIISNDNSPDDTDGVIKGLIKDHPKAFAIKYIRHETNLGMMPNFLFSVGQGEGKYQAFCEGDDYWTDPLKLQKQVDFLEGNIEYAGCAHQSMVLKNAELSLFNDNVFSEVTVDDIIGKRLFHTASLVFRKDVLTLFQNAPKVFSGDRLLFFCIAISGRFKYFSESMCIYRLHNAGASSTAKTNQIILDLNSITYLKSIYPAFPRYKYMSYVYATVGLCRNGPFFKRIYYLILSFLLSFSYFPENLFRIFRYVKNRL